MAARIEYTKELKRQVLEEISDGANIEDVSKRYEVPVVVIEEWLKRERTETYINAVFLNTHEHHTSKFTSVKESVNSVVAWVKARALMGGLLAGYQVSKSFLFGRVVLDMSCIWCIRWFIR